MVSNCKSRECEFGVMGRAGKSTEITPNLQHAIWLIPMQLMLDVYSSFGLNHKAGQTQQQEAQGNQVSLAGCLGGIIVRAFTPDGWPAGVVQHRPGLCIAISEASSGVAAIFLVLE